MSKSEQRARRKAVREKIADMPGKLDHASGVCYRVGRKYTRSQFLWSLPQFPWFSGLQSPINEPCETEPTTSCDRASLNIAFENFNRQDKATVSVFPSLQDP